MEPKFYTSFASYLKTAAAFLIIALLLSVIFNILFQEQNQKLTFYRLIIFLVGSMIFEFQKRRLGISLSKRILGPEVKQVFAFNNGRPLDIFDNFLAISDEKIIMATYYTPIQKKLSFLIRKPLFLKVIPIEQVVGHTKKGNDLELILRDEGKLILKDIPNLAGIQLPHQH